MNLQKHDLEELKQKGISVKELQSQIDRFVEGVKPVQIVKQAMIGDGIIRLDRQDIEQYKNTYEESNDIEVLKFVPASGAATRMFRALHQFISEVDIDKTAIESKLQFEHFKLLQPLFKSLEKLAFYEEAKQGAKKETQNFENLSNLEKNFVILKQSIAQNGLNLANLPKGLIPFHKYKDKKLTPFEEHLEESITYAEKQQKVNLHFSISDGLDKEFQNVLKQYLRQDADKSLGFNVTYSYQKPSTDTIAVNEDNTPYRDENGKLFFRPGGHGALIYNLNQLDADVIFIKNIDNVSKNAEHKAETTLYKKALAGVLLSLKQQIKQYLALLESGPVNDKTIKDIHQFMQDKLNVTQPAFTTEELFNQLNKPLRVCGMVINDGAPGGGPFWIKDKQGHISLQIIETSQIDLTNKSQKKILNDATHFNPVDIVCSTKDYKGQKFDLLKYVNKDRAFIAKKSINGHPIKALERPGLWNGAMEYWLTVFVEVPLSTFNPVKTIVDLLKPAHQNI